MTQYQSDFLQILNERGFIHQCTASEGLDAAFKRGKVTAYIGFDCTAPSLHVGSLIQIMVLRWLQKTGNKPIVLLGGATTQVGDPSGRDETRKLLTGDDISRNMASIRELFGQFLRLGGGAIDAQVVNNNEWLTGLNYIEFLRDVGRHFSVNRMLTQDSVKLRLEREQNLSFLEFNYMVLQAYDFVKLARDYGCHLQIGGSDQWGNIIMGIELFRRMEADAQAAPTLLDPKAIAGAQVLEVQPFIRSVRDDSKEFSSENFAKHMNEESGNELFGLTTPLLTTASGAKMGKTAAGAVWLHKDMMSAYDYWQYWRNTEDGDVGRFLRLFTELPMAEIKKLEKLKGAEINEAKKILATEATKLCHGDKAAKLSAETAQKTFEQGITAENLPEFHLTREALGKGMPAYELFRQAGLSASGGEARRLIRGGGAKVNDQKVSDENALIEPTLFDADGQIKLTAGKKRYMLVKLES